MRRSSVVFRLSVPLILLFLAASCAGAPAVPVAAAPAVTTTTTTTVPPPVRKERTVTVEVAILAKETVLYPDGLVDVYSAYTWDEGRRNLLEKKTFDPARPDPVERVAYEYAAGRLSAELLYDSEGKLKNRREYGYGEGGFLVAERVLDPRGQAQSSSAYANDAAGNRTEWRSFNDKGMLQAVTSYTWAADGLVLISFANAAGAKTGSIKVDRPAPGQEKRSYLGPDGALQKLEISLFEKGALKRFESRRADGSLAQAVDYRLGTRGEALESLTTDGAGKVREKRVFEYTVRVDQKIEVYYE